MTDENSIAGISVSSFYAYTIAIVIGSIVITIIFTGLAYLTLRCLKKRRRAEPEYYIDDIKIQNDPPGYEKENFDAVPFPEPQLVQVQPILTVSEVVSSVKQSLEVLGHAITPKRWSTVQPTPVDEEKPASEI